MQTGDVIVLYAGLRPPSDVQWPARRGMELRRPPRPIGGDAGGRAAEERVAEREDRIARMHPGPDGERGEPDDDRRDELERDGQDSPFRGPGEKARPTAALPQ